ncbi:MAG: hypothetical protein NVSMB38_02970 [Ktedonobacteraceae bacterium]
MNKETQHLGKYELQERLGQGGMAEVWKALDTQLQRYVAIKIMHANLQNDPDFLKRFEREARVIASLHHSNIVQIFDFQVARPPETESTIAYMVMDYIEGQTLADYIHDTSHSGRFPPISDIIHIFTAISTAIDYAHQKGMIHRDIKPANIMLDKRNVLQNPIGEPTLTDFDVAKLLGGSATTLSSAWMGTPLYISPEQAQGHPGDERSDIYSLGVILYEICTGVPPFQGKNATDVLMQHKHATPRSPELINQHIPPALSKVILRSLAKNPMERFSSASAMTIAVVKALNMPIPESLTPPAFQADMSEASTHQSSPLQGFSAPHPMLYTTTPPSPDLNALTLRKFATPTGSGQSTPTTPTGSISSNLNAHLAQNVSQSTLIISTPPTSSTTAVPPSPPHGRKRGRPFFVVFIAFLLLLVLCSGFWAFSAFIGNKPVSAVNQIVGHAYFGSSGAFSEGSTNGISDELHLSIPTMPSPASGNRYYLWLLSDLNKNPTTFIALGAVSLNHGGVDTTYTTPQHTNLIATTSRLLITEEKVNPAPSSFSPNRHMWRYYAEIPQTKINKGNPHISTLGFLRLLLFEGGQLSAQGLHGGSANRLLRNTQKVLEWAGSARDEWDLKNVGLMHRHFIRILDYLDGSPFIQEDLPPGTPLLVNPLLAQVGLINLNLRFKQATESYTQRVASNVLGVIHISEGSPAKQRLATLTEKDIRVNVANWLELVRKDAKQLVLLTDAQLAQRSTLPLLNDVVTQARYAFSGQFDPASDQLQGGALLDYDHIQLLASFDIVPYTAK